MKYIVILGDGMSDFPVPELGNSTPLEAAEKPNMDWIAANGESGMLKTVPDGMKPGSDNANLSAMGYDPVLYYTGRSPLEAVSMGIDLAADDLALRCNLVTLAGDGPYETLTMEDYSSDEILTEEAAELISALDDALGDETRRLYPGISYRHCLVLHGTAPGNTTTPPHDILGKCVADYLPAGKDAALLLELQKKSYSILREHPVNRARAERGLRMANSCWFWGEGTKPALPLFEDLYGVKGAVISAVDLLKGIGMLAGLKVAEVEGATGNIHTNFAGKAQCALSMLQSGCDYVYIHVEAPDECGHRAEIDGKVRAIELIDREIVGPILTRMRNSGEPFVMAVLPDHPTPLSLRTHISDPVPFAIYRSETAFGGTGFRTERYTEALAQGTGLYLESGPDFARRLFGKNK